MGAAASAHHECNSASPCLVAGLRAAVALAGRGGGVCDRRKIMEGETAICFGRRASLPCISRFQSTLGGVSLQPLFYCAVFLSLLDLMYVTGNGIAEALLGVDRGGPVIFRAQFVDDGIFLCVGTGADWGHPNGDTRRIFDPA